MFTAIGVALAMQAATPDVTVVVTARKRPEPLVKVPESVTVFSAQTVRNQAIGSVADFATRTPNLSFAYGNGSTAIGDARTLAIRGVSGPGTTAVYIDQTPVPDSIDPRLVDIDHIEVLKGPQGTLYGEGSLGGSVKIVTYAPSLQQGSLDVTAEAGATSGGGSADGGASVVQNIVAVPNRVATRIVVFAEHDAGFLTRTFDDQRVGDQGAQSAWGASVSTLVHVNDRFDATLRLMYQRQDDYGFPAAFAPLPAFRPVTQLPRAFDIQPKVEDRWFMPSFDLAWRGDGWRVESSTSYFARDIHEVEDSTLGTAQFLASIGTPLSSQPYVWTSHRRRTQVSHETRLFFGAADGVNGVAGVFVSSGRDDFVIPPIDGAGLAAAGDWGNDLLWQSDIRDSQQNAALFGELYYPFLSHFTLTLGARQYWLRQTYQLTADGYLDGGLSDGPAGRNQESGLSPKIALSYQPTDGTQFYASAAKGFRAGGSGQAVIPACDASLAQIGLSEDGAARYASDTVWSYEAGAKQQLAGANTLVTAALYHLDWNNIQQSVFLPSCAFIITANAGAAAADGGELEVAGQPTPQWGVRFGLGYEDARITRAGDSGQPVGARVYQVPRWTTTAATTYDRALTGGMSAFVDGDVDLVGDSASDNSGGGLERVRPAYVLVNGRVGVRWGQSELSLDIKNLTNVRVNLGDIGYLGYAQHQAGDPDGPEPQVVTLPPLSAVVRFRRRY